MAIPKRVWSNKRTVWHDEKYQVYQKDGKLMYQDRGIWKEATEPTLLSYAEVMALPSTEARVEELNKAPVAYYEKFSEEGNIVDGHLKDDIFCLWDEISQEWVQELN